MENARRVTFDSTKDIQSPRFRAILRVTSGRRRRSADVKSFSHELNGNGPRRLPNAKLSGLRNTEDFMKVIRMKFNRLKEEVDSELAIYAGDLVNFLQKSTEDHPEWRVPIEDLLLTSQQCAEMSPEDFWDKCEEIVQNLDDRRQELPTGALKQAHTRILFILTRCTRLLHFQKEGVYSEGDHVLGFHQFSDLGVYPTSSGRMLKTLLSSTDFKERLMRRRIHEHKISGSVTSPSGRARISSWKKLPSAAEKNQKKEHEYDGAPSREVLESFLRIDKVRVGSDDNVGKLDASSEIIGKPIDPSLQGQEAPGAEHDISDEKMKMICRICDFEIPTVHAEGHFRVCTFADRCDMKGLSVDQRLERVADILEKILEYCLSKCPDNAAIGHEDGQASASTSAKESDLTSDQSILSCPPSTDPIDCIPEATGSATTKDLKDLPSILLSTNSAILDQGPMVLSSGSVTPNSPLPTPDSSHISLLLGGMGVLSEHENSQQVLKKADMIRKNAVESILAERNILISVRNPFVLTDFGLSKVGLINSTDDLSGPDVSSSLLSGDHEPLPASVRVEKREERQKQSAIGTPDYLAPEILLGMQHGPTADWWSVGVILYELLVGIPPFNAEHPQKIFDNIMNRDIPWPRVPEEMSCEAHDLIDKLLIGNPVQRLGATGAGEVKRHPFFANINWDMLARQKATFIPSTDGDDDTSYFASRHTWNATDDLIHAISNDEDDVTDTSCSSSPFSTDQDEEGDECSQLAGFGASNLGPTYSFSNFSFKNLSQLASINYDLITKTSKDSEEASHS
ncbi:hypothetical protein J5N97_012533 [Dioscorea zingiberensis]|uniref:non-specific serine/threonine protein kinase n=1 Tax=Dioscorea zingiberensis TaxID=325984 RepID=A0A9D5HHW1_9LILI|nr:hypothetical protein J5N97_012533 [Dioscorea zingiberensis]